MDNQMEWKHMCYFEDVLSILVNGLRVVSYA